MRSGLVRWLALSGCLVVITVAAVPRKDVELITQPRPGEEFVVIQTQQTQNKQETKKDFSTSHHIPTVEAKRELTKSAQRSYSEPQFTTSHKISRPAVVVPTKQQAVTFTRDTRNARLTDELDVVVEPEGETGVLDETAKADPIEVKVMARKSGHDGISKKHSLKKDVPQGHVSDQRIEKIQINPESSSGVKAHEEYKIEKGEIGVPPQKKLTSNKASEVSALSDSQYDVVTVTKPSNVHKVTEEEESVDFVDSPLSDKALVPSGTSQNSRINIKKGPNGQDYEYEYVYYYYDDEEELPTKGKGVYNAHDGPLPAAPGLQSTTTTTTRAPPAPTTTPAHPQEPAQRRSRPSHVEPEEEPHSNSRSRPSHIEPEEEPRSSSRSRPNHVEPEEETRSNARSRPNHVEPEEESRSNARHRYTTIERNRNIPAESTTIVTTPEPASNEVLPVARSGNRFRGRQLVPAQEEAAVPEERLPASTRFPSRGRSGNAQTPAAAPVTDTPITRIRGNSGSVRRPSLELVDSSSFRTHASDVSPDQDERSSVQSQPEVQTSRGRGGSRLKDPVYNSRAEDEEEYIGLTVQPELGLKGYTGRGGELTVQPELGVKGYTGRGGELTVQPELGEKGYTGREGELTTQPELGVMGYTGRGGELTVQPELGDKGYTGRRGEANIRSQEPGSDRSLQGFPASEPEVIQQELAGRGGYIQPTTYSAPSIATTGDSESTTAAVITTAFTAGMSDKGALDLYAILQQTQSEESNLLTGEKTTQDSDPATGVDTSTSATEPSTTTREPTTTSTTTEPTTTTTTTTAAAVPSIGRGRYRGGIGNRNRVRLNGASTTTASSVEPTNEEGTTKRARFEPSRNRITGQVSAYGRRGQKTTTAPETSDPSNDNAESETPRTRGRYRSNGGSRNRVTTESSASVASAETTVSSAASPSRPSFQPDRFNLRRRGGLRSTSTIAPPPSEEPETSSPTADEAPEDPSLVPTTPTTQRPRSRLPIGGARPLRPGPRINIGGRGRLGVAPPPPSTVPAPAEGEPAPSSTTEAAPVEEHQPDTHEAADTTTTALPDALTRLRNRPRLRVSEKAHKAAATPTPARRQLVSGLLPRRRNQQEASSTPEPVEEKPEEEPEVPVVETTVAPSSSEAPTSATTESRLNSLIAGRRRIAGRRPGTLLPARTTEAE